MGAVSHLLLQTAPPILACMSGHLHLLKLSVGTESIDDLMHWQRQRSRQVEDGQYYHVTRMWPKREDELLDGGSIFWVIKGVILARQRIVALKEHYREDGIRRCAICLDPEVVRVAATTKSAFQGWRYLNACDAPADLPKGRAFEDALPPELTRALADIGVR